MVKILWERFMNKNYKNYINLSLELKKTITIKGDKLYVKWKGYDNSLYNWIKKSDIYHDNESILS